MADHPAITIARALFGEGKPVEAMDTLRAALKRTPADPGLNYNLAGMLLEAGRMDEAEFFAERAASAAPKVGLYASLHGEVLMHRGRFPQAERRFRAAIAADAKLYSARQNLANLRVAAMDYDEAESLLREAASLRPDRPEAPLNLANVLVDTARASEARVLVERVLAQFPTHPVAAANLANLLNYTPGVPRDAVAAAHRRFGDLLTAASPVLPAPTVTRDPDRKLRLAFVSADLREHSVAYFIEPVLRHLDRSQFEVFAFSRALKPDAVTERLKAVVDHWIDARSISETELAHAIQSQQIDIAIELSGLTQGNSLTAFAMRPAPVQLSYLGYPNSTGVPAIPGRLVDSITDPAEEPALHDGDHPIRLDPIFLCYRSATDLHGKPAPLAAPPRNPGTPPTFASFNVISKLNEPLVDVWAAILNRVPDARLLLKARSLASPSLRQRLTSWLTQRGVSADRLELLAYVPSHADHLKLYQRVDVALDPFPYAGTTTTCEALSMGVPVVTLRGDRHAGRVGASILGAAGLRDLIADSTEAYIDRAATLIRDRETLDGLRATLRGTLSTGPLGDGPAMGARFGQALRSAWRQWCANPGQ